MFMTTVIKCLSLNNDMLACREAIINKLHYKLQWYTVNLSLKSYNGFMTANVKTNHQTV